MCWTGKGGIGSLLPQRLSSSYITPIQHTPHSNPPLNSPQTVPAVGLPAPSRAHAQALTICAGGSKAYNISMTSSMLEHSLS